MEILIDEAGSFVNKNSKHDSWSVVAAYIAPESEKRKYRKALSNLKRSEKVAYSEEIKLRHVDENNYFKFLTKTRTSIFPQQKYEIHTPITPING